jgi:hypothetical protein
MTHGLIKSSSNLAKYSEQGQSIQELRQVWMMVQYALLHSSRKWGFVQDDARFSNCKAPNIPARYHPVVGASTSPVNCQAARLLHYSHLSSPDQLASPLSPTRDWPYIMHPCLKRSCGTPAATCRCHSSAAQLARSPSAAVQLCESVSSRSQLFNDFKWRPPPPVEIVRKESTGPGMGTRTTVRPGRKLNMC